jgi:hypothetical protein
MSSGLQGQRTELAWLRMTLSSWAMAALTVRLAFPMGLLAMTGPVALTAIAHARRRQLRDGGTLPALSRRAAMLTAAACVLISLAGAVLF